MNIRNLMLYSAAIVVAAPAYAQVELKTYADRDGYLVKVRTEIPGFTGFRLEALADEALPQHGPGRGASGRITAALCSPS